MVVATGYAVRQRPASLFKQQLCDINVEMSPCIFHAKTALKGFPALIPNQTTKFIMMLATSYALLLVMISRSEACDIVLVCPGNEASNFNASSPLKVPPP
jgi:hypothetical protein